MQIKCDGHRETLARVGQQGEGLGPTAFQEKKYHCTTTSTFCRERKDKTGKTEDCGLAKEQYFNTHTMPIFQVGSSHYRNGCRKAVSLLHPATKQSKYDGVQGSLASTVQINN
jgi:hypothetical protein